MAEKELKIKISADITELNTALGQMNTQIKSQMGSILDLGKQMGIAFTAVGGGIAAALGLSAKAFSDAQKEGLKLDAALRSTAGAIGLSRKELDALATSLSRVTAFDDDAITGAEALALSFTNIGKDVLPQAIEAAMNMSVALGEDLNSAMMKVGRALNDPSGLKAMKVMTTDQKELAKQLFETGDVMGAQAVILEALGRAYGGQARSEAKGFEGQMKQLSVEAHNLMEVIGGALMPAINDLVGSLKPAVIGITDWAKANPDLVSQLALTAAGIAGVMLVLGPLLIALPTLVTSFGLISTAAAATVAAMGGLTLAFGAVLPAIMAAGVAIFKTTQAFIGWRTAVASWVSANTQLGNVTEQLNTKLKAIGAGVDRGTDSWESYTDRVRESAAAHLEQIRALDQAEKSETKLGISVGKTKKELAEEKKEAAAAKKALDDHNKAIEKLLDDQENLNHLQEISAENWKDLAEWSKKNAENLINVAEVMSGRVHPAAELVIGDIGKLTDKNKELEDAWKTLGGTSRATLNKQADDAHEAYKRIAADASSTIEDIKAAWDLYQKKVQEVNGEVTSTTKKTTEDVKGFWASQVSTVVTDFSKGVTDIIFHGGNLKTKLIDIFKEIGESIVRAIIENGIKKIIIAIMGGGTAGGGGTSGGGTTTGGAVGSLSDVFDKLASKVKSVFENLKDSLGKIIGSVFDSLKSIGGAIGDFFGTLGGKIAGIAGGAGALVGGLFTGGPAGTALSIGGGALAGAQLGSMIFPGIGTPIGAGIGALLGGIASLFGKDQDKIDDTKIVQQGWPLVWKLEDQYANSPLAGSPEAEAGNRWAILDAGINIWNDMVHHFKRPESRTTQRSAVLDFIAAVNKVFLERYQTYSDRPAIPNTLPVQPLAQGGIVTRPILIGDAGPEAVIPLNSRRGRNMLGGHTVNQTINIQGSTSLHDFRRMMDRINRHNVRQFGFAR